MNTPFALNAVHTVRESYTSHTACASHTGSRGKAQLAEHLVPVKLAKVPHPIAVPRSAAGAAAVGSVALVLVVALHRNIRSAAWVRSAASAVHTGAGREDATAGGWHAAKLSGRAERRAGVLKRTERSAARVDWMKTR